MHLIPMYLFTELYLLTISLLLYFIVTERTGQDRIELLVVCASIDNRIGD